MVARHTPGQSILFPPDIAWVAPSELPTLGGVHRLGVDVETCDPDLNELGPGTRRGAYIVGLCLATDDGRSWYLPVRHQGGGNLSPEMVWAWAREELNAFTGIVVGANLSYDLDFLANEGVTFPLAKAFHDVQIAEPLLDEHKLSYSLDSLAQEYLGEKKSQVVLDEAASAWGFGSTDKQIKQNLWRLHAGYVGLYGESDASQPLRILDLQMKKLEDQGLVELFGLESRLLPILVAMRRRGVKVDVEGAHRVRDRLVIERDAALARVRRLAGPKAELMAPDSFAQALVDRGLNVGRTPKSGQFSVTKGWLQQNAGDELVDAIQAGRKVNTIITTFIDGHIFNHAVNGRIHCQYKQLKDDEGGTGARFCLSGDTPIMVPGGTKPIQDIVVGDKVYSYDNEKQLKLGRVIWSGQTGLRQVMRLAVRGEKTRKILLITPEHQVRLVDGSYRSVKDLKKGDRVMSLSRGGGKDVKDYAWLRIFGDVGRPKAEHRVVYMIEHGDLPEHVHHMDEDRSNNSPDNLEGHTKSDHLRHHMTSEEASRRVKLAHSRSDSIRVAAAFALTKYSKLRNPVEKLVELTKQGFSPRQIQDEHHVGKNTVKLRLQEAGLDEWSWIEYRVTKRVMEGFNDSEVIAGFSIHSKRARAVLDRLRANNHRVESIEYLPGLHEVYDIEVEDYHNFIANEICTHNSSSSPNLQNIPARDEELSKLVRGLFQPDDGCEWELQDQSQMEYRLQVHYARGRGAKEARQQYNEDPTTDFHKFCAVLLNANPNDDVLRKKIKNTNFAKSYGALAPKLALTFGCSVEEAQAFITVYEEKLPFTKTTFDAAQAAASQKGFIRSLLGRYARFPLWEPADNSRQKTQFRKRALPREQAEAEYGKFLVRAGTYKALNNLLQFGNADYIKKSMVDIWEAGLCTEDLLGPFLLQVHDELDYSVPLTLRGDEAAKEAKRLMETSIPLRVPVLVKAKRGPNWGACE